MQPRRGQGEFSRFKPPSLPPSPMNRHFSVKTITSSSIAEDVFRFKIRSSIKKNYTKLQSPNSMIVAAEAGV